MNRKKKMQTISIMILLTVSIFCTQQTVSGCRAAASLTEQEQYFEVLEQEYMQNMGRLLSDAGYANSGITMTSITEADGTREYTVLLHHDRFKRLSEKEKNELASQLAGASFAQDDVPFVINFYE